jgi:hypothetical protein
MTTAVSPVDRIRRAADLLAAAGEGTVADALAQILEGVPPEEALGLKASAGKRSPLLEDRLRRRDAELRNWRAAFYAGVSDREAARQMLRRFHRYSGSGLRQLPHEIGGELQHIAQIINLRVEMPGATRLRAVLSEQ